MDACRERVRAEVGVRVMVRWVFEEQVLWVSNKGVVGLAVGLMLPHRGEVAGVGGFF